MSRPSVRDAVTRSAPAPLRRLGWLALLPLSLVLSIGTAALPAPVLAASDAAPSTASIPPSTAAAANQLAALPLRFEANRGQSDGRVRFLSRVGSSMVFLTATGATWSLAVPGTPAPPVSGPGALPDGLSAATGADAGRYALRMSLVGANPAPDVVGTDRLPGVS